MGLSASSSNERLSDDDSLSPRERDMLLSLFHKTGTEDDFEISLESFCAIFDSVTNPQFGPKLYEVMKDQDTSALLRFSAFRRAIAFACKTTSSNCIRLIFKVYDTDAVASVSTGDRSTAAEGKSSSAASTTTAASDVKGFLRFCCEVGEALGNGVSVANVEVLADKMYQHFKAKSISISSGGASKSSFTVLNNWLNEYFPCVAQLLLTYINTLCFPESITSNSSSFSPFCAPHVAGDATITKLKSKLKPLSAQEGVEGDGDAESGGATNSATPSSHHVAPAPVTAALPSILVKHNEMLLLGMYSKMLQGSWRLLYSSDKHGMSFNRIAHHLLGYDGPTCILIRCADEPVETILGMFSESRWKDSNRFYGTAENILFTLSPALNIYRASGGPDTDVGSSAAGSSGASASTNSAAKPNANCSTNYQYLNMKTYGYPHGFGMGGALDRFRIFIPDTMDEGTKDHKECTGNDSDLTYESGALVTPSENTGFISNVNDLGTRFNIECLEVWACGGDEIINSGLSAQSKDRDVRAENINKARQCDKAAFANNTFDQEFLLGKTFEHKVRMAEDAPQS